MAPDEVAMLQDRLERLEKAIDNRIAQEDRIQKEYWKTLKAELGGEISKISSMFQAHCSEEYKKEDKLHDSINTVHRRIDEILNAMNAAKTDIYQSPDARMSAMERQIAGTCKNVTRLDTKIALYIGYAVGGISVLYTVISVGLRIMEIMK